MKNADETAEKEDKLWTIRRFCDESGLVYSTVKARLENKGLSTERGERFTLRQFIDAYNGDIEVQKLRELTARAEEQEIKVARLKGELVELETVQSDFSRWAHRIKSVIEREVDSDEARMRIFKAIRKPLNEEVKGES